MSYGKRLQRGLQKDKIKDMEDLFTMTISLFLLMDSIGNVPVFLSILKEIDQKRQRVIIFRELIIALFVIIFFYFLGDVILGFLNISQQAVLISGGIILFVIALKLIFAQKSPDNNNFSQMSKEPFIVPLAIPLVAGPAVLASVMLYSRQEINTLACMGAILIAWSVSTIILLSSVFLKRLLGDRGISACERLTGLILIMLAVQMFLDGIAPIFKAQ